MPIMVSLTSFLSASSHFYKRSCPLVGRLVGRSVGRCVCLFLTTSLTGERLHIHAPSVALVYLNMYVVTINVISYYPSCLSVGGLVGWMACPLLGL